MLKDTRTDGQASASKEFHPEFSKEKLMHEVPRKTPHPPTALEPGNNMEGEIQKPQWNSADRGHHRSHPQCGPLLVPAHPGTAGGTNTARSPG